MQYQSVADPHLSHIGLLTKLVKWSQMKCTRHVFEAWLHSLPLPAATAPMDDEDPVLDGDDFITDAVFLAKADVVWESYKANPHVGPEAMVDLWYPLLRRVSVTTARVWLSKARKKDLPLERMRLYRPCVEDYISEVSGRSVPQIVVLLKAEFNIKVTRDTMHGLLQEIQQPPDMRVLTAAELDDSECHLDNLLETTPPYRITIPETQK